MASPQLIELLHQLLEAGERKPLRWEPLKRSYSSRCDFGIALGSAVVHLTGHDDNQMTRLASYSACLMTRGGLVVDELEADQHESEYFPLVEALFLQAREAAFNLPRMLAEIQDDLAAGRARELPKEVIRPGDDDIPF